MEITENMVNNLFCYRCKDPADHFKNEHEKKLKLSKEKKDESEEDINDLNEEMLTGDLIKCISDMKLNN